MRDDMKHEPTHAELDEHYAEQAVRYRLEVYVVLVEARRALNWAFKNSIGTRVEEVEPGLAAICDCRGLQFSFA